MWATDRTELLWSQLIPRLAASPEKIVLVVIDAVAEVVTTEIRPQPLHGIQFRPLEERAKQLEDEIPTLQAEIAFLEIQYLSSDEILSEAKDLYSRWPSLDQAEKRKIVEVITEKIAVSDQEITINLCYLPPSPTKNMTVWERSRRDSNPRNLSVERFSRPSP